MSTGALIFAYNNEKIDYLAMAKWSAKNIERHLGIPTHIVTGDKPASTNTRNFNDLGVVSWHNQNRMDAYELSPWDRTLVLDADYVVASNQLKTLLEVDQDFLAHRLAYDVTEQNNFEGLNYFGDNRMPMWWATVMMFRRSEYAESIFNCMAMIRDNWTHYRNLFKNTKATYRNDHALTIALGIVNGHTLDHPGIPWRLASLLPECELVQTQQDTYRVKFVTTENTVRWIELTQDFHAMGKKQLGEIVASVS